ncbi:serine/threonine-protein phosphatase 7 long form homolog [Benincasa hispida]|uniref:serine/threonine-protein phosphatase 7 long form homolog n=1 Tax=Benincasa hispida TaxID=102211 RepID=UPI00190054CF|nr:serine/threonine-protein phosphatase 7 long form homolog [Benincasa hispida]
MESSPSNLVQLYQQNTHRSQSADFLRVAQIGFIHLDWYPITALVERWRPETHIFHLPCGECTITLQDVAIQFGLRVDGQPLTGSLQYDWKNICEELLGVLPDDLKGSRSSILWLASQFPELPPDADDINVRRYARAYIMQLIGGFLFADKSNNLLSCSSCYCLDFEHAGTYSWGGAYLAWLYRELCRAINAQPLEITLLQLWAYDRFPIVALQV